MRIRTNFFASLDGYIAAPDGRPVQLLLPNFTGADSHGLALFLKDTEAVLMGRTTFLPALGAPQWPWKQPVFVLTTSALPEETPDHVATAATPEEMLERLRAAGITGDVHLVGGPTTMHAFRAIGALDELHVHVASLLLGSGTPLSPPGTEPLSLTLQESRGFPDGVVELTYTLAGREADPAHLKSST